MTRKKLITWALLIFVGAGLAVATYRAVRESRVSGATAVTQQSTIPAAALMKDGILVYYFHGFARCQTCMKLEAYTREAVETGFGPELKSGRIKWQVVNVEEPENRHFVRDFQLTNKSVVLAVIQGGIMKDWKNLPLIWELVGDKDRFLKYIQGEVRTCRAKP